MPVKESVRQRITTTLFIGQSLYSAAIIGILTLMVITAADLANDDASAGIPHTMALVGRALAAYPIGWLLDKAGRRIGLSTGFGLAITGSVIAIWAIMAGSFFFFSLGALIMGMGRASSDQSRYVAAEVSHVDKRAKVIGLIVFAGTIGAILGPQLAAPSQEWATSLGLKPAAGPFLIGIILFAVGLLVIMLFLRPDPKEISQAIEIEDRHVTETIPPRPLRQIFQQPTVVLAIASMTIGQLVMALLMVITPLHMNHHDHNTQAISFVISAHTFGMFALSGLTGWLIDRFGRIPLIFTGSLILISASILAAQATAVLSLAFALFLLGLGWNFCFIAGSSLLSDSLAASERARTQGMSETMVGLAAGSASFFSGFIFASAGMATVGAVGLGFSLLIFAFLIYYGMSRRLVQQPEMG